MQKRAFGNSGFSASEIGLGTWQFGGDFGSIDEQKCFKILDRALEGDINFFDTADVYGAGKSEEILGSYFRDKDKTFFLATKYGRDGAIFPNNYSRENMLDSIKASQDRLQRSSLDLLQLHCIPKEELVKGDVFDWLREMKALGHIKNFGASVETMEEAKICMKQEGLCSLQIIFNIFRQNPITEIFDEALSKNIGIIVRLPLASGLLAGKYSKETHFEESDHRNYNRDGKAFSVGETFSGIPFEKGLDFVEEIRPLVPTDKMTMAQFSLRWILDHPAVSTVIAGASKVEQVDSNIAASQLASLDQQTHETLTKLYNSSIEQEIRSVF